MYFKKIYSCIFLIFAFIFANCIMFKGERTYSKNGVMVTYRSLNRFGSGIENYRIQHPIGISAKRVNNHLLNLFYRKIDPPGKAKPIFSSERLRIQVTPPPTKKSSPTSIIRIPRPVWMRSPPLGKCPSQRRPPISSKRWETRALRCVWPRSWPPPTAPVALNSRQG